MLMVDLINKLQRLTALPFWRVGTPRTEEQVANDAVFPWVATLEDTANFEVLQEITTRADRLIPFKN